MTETKNDIRRSILNHVEELFEELTNSQVVGASEAFDYPEDPGRDRPFNSYQVYWILKFLGVVPRGHVNSRGNVQGTSAYKIYKKLSDVCDLDADVPTNVNNWYGYKKDQLEQIRDVAEDHELPPFPTAEEIEERLKEIDPNMSDARAKSEAKRLHRHETSKLIEFDLDDIDVEVRRTAKVNR